MAFVTGEGINIFVSIPAPGSSVFSAPITIPVDELRTHPLSGAFLPLHGVSSLTVTLRDVVVAASRYLNVHASAFAPHPNIIQEWQAILAWEIERFWDIDPALPRFESVYAASTIYTSEHHQRSGEHLAAGLALLFANTMPTMSLAGCSFYGGIGARPDFVLPMALTTGKLVGLEARCRAYEATLDVKRDVDPVLTKKGNPYFSNIIAVIFHHGRELIRKSSVTGRKSTTRLVAFDEETEARPLDKVLWQEIVFTNYERLFAEVGLSYYREKVGRALASLTTNVSIPAADPEPFRLRGNIGRHPLLRTFSGMNFVGREFSTFLRDISGLRSEQREALFEAAVRAGGLGSFGFVGVSEDVLRLIHDGNWDGLCKYRNKSANPVDLEAATILSDGSCNTMRLISDGDKAIVDIGKSL